MSAEDRDREKLNRLERDSALASKRIRDLETYKAVDEERGREGARRHNELTIEVRGVRQLIESEGVENRKALAVLTAAQLATARPGPTAAGVLGTAGTGGLGGLLAAVLERFVSGGGGH